MPDEAPIPLEKILAVHRKKRVDKGSANLDELNKKILSWHKKHWWILHHPNGNILYGAPIEHSLHCLSLKYRNKCFSGLVENVQPKAKIFEFDSRFSCSKMSKILLVRYSIDDKTMYQIYDGSHRLAYLSYYGLKKIPSSYVHIADEELDLFDLLPGSTKEKKTTTNKL